MAYYVQSSTSQQPPPFQYAVNGSQYAGPVVAFQHHQPPAYGKYDAYFSKSTATSLGAFGIVLGCISISAGIMALLFWASLCWIGTGIWCGVFFIAAGGVAISAGQDRTDGKITSTAIMSAFLFVFGLTELIIASIGLYFDIYYDYNWSYGSNWIGAAVASNSLMIAVSSLEIIFAIWLFSVSCRAISSGSNAVFAEQMVVQPMQYSLNGPGNVMLQTSQLQAPPSYYQGQQQQQQFQQPTSYYNAATNQHVLFVTQTQPPYKTFFSQ